MLVRGLTLSIATLMAFGVLAGSAEADHRKKQRRAMAYDHYYAGPQVVRGIPGLRLLFGDYALSEEEYDALYGPENPKNFDESYYEPDPAPPPKLKKKAPAKATRSPASNPAVTGKKPDAKPKVAATSKIEDEEKSVSSKTSGQTGTGLTCDKAGSIVGDYGFSGIKPQSCKGKVYAFNATRDGKSFAIKVDSVSGELTEVKKLQ